MLHASAVWITTPKLVEAFNL